MRNPEYDMTSHNGDFQNMRIDSRKRSKESGFTLIELLTVILTIGILAATSVQSHGVLRQRVYDTAAEDMIRNAKTALEAGKGNFEHLDNAWLWVDSDSKGRLSGWGPDGALSGRDIVPGLVVNEDTRISVNYSTWCNAANIASWGCRPTDLCCVSESIMARHCKGRSVYDHVIWNNGYVMELKWDNWGC